MQLYFYDAHNRIQSYFCDCFELFLISVRSNIFTTLSKLFFPKNEMSKFQKINSSKASSLITYIKIRDVGCHSPFLSTSVCSSRKYVEDTTKYLNPFSITVMGCHSW